MSNSRGTVDVTHEGNGTWIIALAGEHDISTTPLIDAQTLDIWPRCRLAIIDLRAATFIDSSVVRWIVRARRALDAHGRPNAVHIVEDIHNEPVDLVFDLLAVRGEFPCYSTTP